MALEKYVCPWGAINRASAREYKGLDIVPDTSLDERSAFGGIVQEILVRVSNRLANFYVACQVYYSSGAVDR
jgi:hypothetical protein